MVKFTFYLKIIETMLKVYDPWKKEKQNKTARQEHAWKPKETLLIPAVKQEECKTEGSKGGVWRPQTQQSFLSN